MANLKEQNVKRWNELRISADMGPKFKTAADRINSYKSRYETVAKATGVPWWFIGLTHYRESNLNFNTYLGNGQVLSKKTTIVPKGRGPFKTWEDGAIDALTKCPPYASKNKDWSIGGSLVMLEQYNGLGYASKGVPSPYLWAGTNQYTKGKYVADGIYSPTAVDKQLGVAGILKFLGIFNGSKAVDAGVATGAAGGIGAIIYSVWNYGTSHWEYIVAGACVALITGLLISYYKSIKEVKTL